MSSIPLSSYAEEIQFMSADNPRTLEVWIDGDCRLCQRSKAWCEHRDRNARIRFSDFRSAADSDLPVHRTDHEASVWARSASGELLGGFAAWQRIVAELPGWRWLATTCSIPPLNLVGPPLYRLIAKIRLFRRR
jgi:predicted DCC family thiol-disulfide oxidoreductase YuxK